MNKIKIIILCLIISFPALANTGIKPEKLKSWIPFKYKAVNELAQNAFYNAENSINIDEYSKYKKITSEEKFVRLSNAHLEYDDNKNLKEITKLINNTIGTIFIAYNYPSGGLKAIDVKPHSSKRFYSFNKNGQYIDIPEYSNYIIKLLTQNWKNNVASQVRNGKRVQVLFNVKHNGDICNIQVILPSDSENFDKDVINFLKNSSPIPSFPEKFMMEEIHFNMYFRSKH